MRIYSLVLFLMAIGLATANTGPPGLVTATDDAMEYSQQPAADALDLTVLPDAVSDAAQARPVDNPAANLTGITPASTTATAYVASLEDSEPAWHCNVVMNGVPASEPTLNPYCNRPAGILDVYVLGNFQGADRMHGLGHADAGTLNDAATANGGHPAFDTLDSHDGGRFSGDRPMTAAPASYLQS